MQPTPPHPGAPALTILPHQILHHYKSRVMVHTENCPESVREKAEDEAEESGYKIFPEFDPSIIAGYGTLGNVLSLFLDVAH